MSQSREDRQELEMSEEPDFGSFVEKTDIVASKPKEEDLINPGFPKKPRRTCSFVRGGY